MSGMALTSSAWNQISWLLQWLLSLSIQPQAAALLLPIAAAAAAIAIYRSSSFCTSTRESCRLPPGPSGLPVVGSLFWLSKLLRGNAKDLRAKYGPIVTVKVGSVPHIIIASAELAREVLIEKGSLFGSRPSNPALAVFSNNFRSINSSPSGPYWRDLRTNLIVNFLSSTNVSAHTSTREDEVGNLISRIKLEAGEKGEVSVLSNCRITILKILYRMCLDKSIDGDHLDEIDKIYKEIFKSGKGSIADYVPWLWFIPKPYLKRQRQVRKRQTELLAPVFRACMKRRKEGNLKPSCYLSSLLALQSEEGKPQFSEDDLITLISEVLNAGTDTTAQGLEWALIQLIIHPDKQAKLYEEISHIAEKSPVSEKDIERLPYLQAVVKETLRMNPPALFTLPHATLRPTKLSGYDIPTNARLFVHLYSIGNDPELWTMPDRFIPERFLDTNINITSGKYLKMIPFGAGRRMCPGWGLAMLHMQLILARLVQSFKWSCANPDQLSSLTEIYKSSLIKTHNLKAIVSER